MTALDLSLIIATAVLCAAAWLPSRIGPRRRVTAFVASVGAVLLGVLGGVMDGPRWEWLLLGAAGGVCVTRVFWRRGRMVARPESKRRILVRLRSGAVGAVPIALLLAAGVAQWALPRPRFPAPTGPYAVATADARWTDPVRPEAATADPSDRRTVVAQAWYPTTGGPTGERGWYLGRTAAEASAVGDGLASTFGVPSFLLSEMRRARGVAVENAPPATGTARFPLVLFSPGLLGVRTQNTVWAMDLAGHGYVVVALDHPYDSAAVVLDGGQVVTTRITTTGDDAEDRRRANAATSLRAADLRFALTQLSHDHVPGLPMLSGRLDTSRAAVAGHSLGGAAAIQAAAEDRRFRAVVDIDGLPRNLPRTAIGRPLLALVAGQSTGSADGDARYATELCSALRLAGPGSYRVTVAGAGHLTFTDAALYLPPVPSLVGTLGRTRGAEITAGATEAFLDVTLRDHGSDGLGARLAEYGTVESP